MNTGSNHTPDTIVLIHGFWVTPRSWEQWIDHYQQRGYRVLAPAYPGCEAEVEALNADPTPITELTVPAIMDRLESLVRQLPNPPILIGHSAGGTFVQLLLDRGLGAAGVALNSAPTQGVRVLPLTQARVLFPLLRNPASRHRAVGMTYPQWRYAFTNPFPADESRRLYDRYAVPASGRILWQTALAGLRRTHQPTFVDYHNHDRSPLLFVSGGLDHLMPPAVQRSNAGHYTSTAVTELREYPDRAHLLPAQQGWREIADEVLVWSVRNARRPAAA
ncbi:alpha/beta fold hydrolase [Natronosporangium hydrolyticum]|uniref:Alpha/beta fold hydrolase n=1 Tax=Natronosporangium hydrolyticum TaxID=2811111 RepID=A0A895YBY8_9ACTN|nr:alpha/beta fold hydrolase [Natronosporangium hydrolyticum]QSB13775.1 alpha/beta fold hydrolase [Natronosporangium hydrolyticum]